MCVFLISPVPITEPLTSELIDTPVFYNLAPRPIKYRVSVPIPSADAGRLIHTHNCHLSLSPSPLSLCASVAERVERGCESECAGVFLKLFYLSLLLRNVSLYSQIL